MVCLGQSIAEKQERVSKNTLMSINKLAVATGQGDYESLKVDDAEQLYLQGEKYFLGFGVERCFDTAYKRYEAAAKLNLPAAITMVATFNEFGIGRTKHMSYAIKMYEKAADLGHADAIHHLGKLSENGKGLELNLKNAYAYYKKAGDKGHLDAMVSQGLLLESGRGCSQNQKYACELFLVAANRGLARAQNAYANCLYHGHGATRDRFEAVIWYKKAAEQGYSPAQYNLGVCYEQGHGIQRDMAQAKILYKSAADHRHPAATCSLGYMFLLEAQYLQAIDAFHIAASLGNTEALFHLGTLYESGCEDNQGTVLAQDLDMALRYYEQAARKVPALTRSTYNRESAWHASGYAGQTDSETSRTQLTRSKLQRSQTMNQSRAMQTRRTCLASYTKLEKDPARMHNQIFLVHSTTTRELFCKGIHGHCSIMPVCTSRARESTRT